ncbi:MAG TPA: prephenate dehydratase [Polyangiaceae bacterium]|jgi:chorismate mutase/prephenate dehydratase|nr:prephenate dehydratase [Polyangiaceae bacterium]
MRVAYFGPAGTHTHAAARSAFPDADEVDLPTIAAVIEAVASGSAEAGVVPIENSTEGGVTSTQDSLLQNDVKLKGEIVLEIAQCLGTREQHLSSIRRVYSHPQGLAQCRRWLAQNLPQAELVAAASTSSAARQAATEPGTAAISSALAAKLNGLTVLAEVQDRAENATRFVIVAREDAAPTGRDKTSLAFTTAHERGALRRALEAFDAEDINLTRIESRPAPGRRWEYVFFTDIEGHRSEPQVTRALERLGAQCSSVKVLGSYPRAE